MKDLTLGYSPCPNDTFIFYALVHGRTDAGDLRFRETLRDVEALNRMALRAELDMTKVSFHAFGNLREEYCLLRSGGALGRGCGPLVVARGPLPPLRGGLLPPLKGKLIAIPGELTTAYLLLQLYDPALRDNVTAMPFNEIMGAVKDGLVDAGLIIHEGRFTCRQYGLVPVMDLGKWWEEKTGLPIPLGCIIAKRKLGKGLVDTIERLVRDSVLYAIKHRDEPEQYIKRHSQELSDSVIKEHINLYVNDYTLDMGEEGIRAVDELFAMAEERGIIKGSAKPFFIGG